MKHSNISLLEKIYSDLAQGNLNGVLTSCDPGITFQVPGKSRLSGKYDYHTVAAGFFEKQHTYAQGTYKLEVHDMLSSDLHATVLASASLMKDGKKVEYRTVHVWRFMNGKPVAWYEYPRDLYQFDLVWG